MPFLVAPEAAGPISRRGALGHEAIVAQRPDLILATMVPNHYVAHDGQGEPVLTELDRILTERA